jgi:hypothetical protein
MIKGSQPSTATPGLTSNTKPRFTADDNIEETGTEGGYWAEDEIPMELEEDGIPKQSKNNQDEQGEGWGDSEIELPADLVSDLFRHNNFDEIFFCFN